MSGRLEVVGLGLMGLSLAWALAEAGWEVYGRDRDPRAEALAETRGVRRGPAPRPDWVVVAVPPSALSAVLEDVGSRRTPFLLTELTSVKGPVWGLLQQLPPSIGAVASHPMAGREVGGYEAAERDLYRGRIWAGMAVPGRPAPWHELEQLIAPLDARLTRVDAAEHDRIVAFTSHLPYLMALALSDTVAGGPPAARELVGPGLLAATRTAVSPTTLWSEILEYNRLPVQEALAALREAIATWDTLMNHASRQEIEQAIRASREKRAAWTGPSV